MTTYAVQRLARMAGVSVRTLHHYDHIGLLKPSGRSQAGYRLYREKEPAPAAADPCFSRSSIFH